MSQALSVTMVISAGLFAGSVAAIAWERSPAWHVASIATFRSDFADTIRRMDRLQPVLLVVSIAASTAFGVTANGTERMLSGVAAACLIAVLAGSVSVLVPLQRRLIDPESSRRVVQLGCERHGCVKHRGEKT